MWIQWILGIKKGSEEDANHWEKGDYSGARLDLFTVYGHIHQQERPTPPPASRASLLRSAVFPCGYQSALPPQLAVFPYALPYLGKYEVLVDRGT